MPRKDLREFFQKDVYKLSPVEFEKCCLEILRGYAEEENLRDFKIVHNEIVKAHDGDYQIDVYSEFTVFGGSKIKVLVECKQYNDLNFIKRERIELLYNRLQSTGCHKGILMATSYFQRGAIRFAQEHGICLIQVMNTYDKFISRADGPDYINKIPIEEEAVFRYPIYSADTINNGRKQVYPTTAAVNLIIDEIKKEKGIIDSN